MRVDRTAHVLADQEEEHNMEVACDRYTQILQIPAGVQHLKHETMGESDCNRFYVWWVRRTSVSLNIPLTI